MQKPLHQLSQNPRYSALMAAARAMRSWPSLDDQDAATSIPDRLRDMHGPACHGRAAMAPRPVVDHTL